MGDVLDKVGWGLFSLVIAVLLVSTFSNNGSTVKQTQLFKQKEFGLIDTYKSWENFANEMDISKRNSKIQDFELVVSKNNKIHSLKFNVIEESTKGFFLYQYKQCITCETKEENKVTIVKDSVDSWSGYSKLIDAKDFFRNLQLVKESQRGKSKYEYNLLRSSGRYDETALEGIYYALNGSAFSEIKPPTNKQYYVAFNIQMVGNEYSDDFSSNADNTKTFLVSEYELKKYD